MPLVLQPFPSSVPHLDVLLDDMERAWQESGRPESIRPHLDAKKEEIRQGKISGAIALEDGRPVGVVWTELPHGTYGSLLLHTLRPRVQAALAEESVRSGYLDNLVLELIQLQPGDEYRRVFGALGLEEKLRQKMALRLDQTPLPPAAPPSPEAPPEVSLEPLTAEHAEISGAISYDAHEASKDLEGYADFSSPERRAALERKIFRGLFGTVIRPASLLLRYRGEPAGVCLIVGIPGWGFRQVAWVLDMAVRPELQGQGLGRLMFRECLQRITAARIPIAGLAVTLSNGHAIRLYEKIGFQPIEQFYEYVGPVKST